MATAVEQMEADSRSKSAPDRRPADKKYWIVLTITYFFLFVGSISSSLLSRFYFIHGGSSRWVATWVQSAGCPLLLIPIFLPYVLNPSNSINSLNQVAKPFSRFTKKLFIVSACVGLMVGFSNFLFSWGTSYLPVSTSSLVLSTQLAFNLVLSVILVRQKLTFLNLNSVILITLGSIVLALGSSHDRPKGVTQAQYFIGFFSILGGALTFALYLPLIELVYRMVGSYEMVMETQLVSQAAAQATALVAMAAAGGFREMGSEATNGFGLGPRAYWVTVGFTLVVWQMSFMGTAGLVYLTKSLTGGVCMTAILPINVLGGVVVFGDKFGANKAITTLLCFWGLVSYVYGEYVRSGKEKKRGVEGGDEEMEKIKENENDHNENGGDENGRN